MRQQKLKIIKKSDIVQATPAAGIQSLPNPGTRHASEVVADWISETRLSQEARRFRDLKAFFGDTITA